MSLNVYLLGETKKIDCACPYCGNKHQEDVSEYLYDGNITSNLTRMADEAGLHIYLWRPDENGITMAGQLIEPLDRGLNELKSDRERFEKFNPANGWGDYEGLVSFVSEYLDACREHPEATVRVSR